MDRRQPAPLLNTAAISRSPEVGTHLAVRSEEESIHGVCTTVVRVIRRCFPMARYRVRWLMCCSCSGRALPRQPSHVHWSCGARIIRVCAELRVRGVYRRSRGSVILAGEPVQDRLAVDSVVGQVVGSGGPSTISTRSSSSRRKVPIIRSQIALGRGACGGLRRMRIPLGGEYRIEDGSEPGVPVMQQELHRRDPSSSAGGCACLLARSRRCGRAGTRCRRHQPQAKPHFGHWKGTQ
jgi:hypothetical protein